MRIYIASPLHTLECKGEIISVVEQLRSLGHEVYSPMELKIPNAWDISNREWAKKVYDNDINELNKADVIVCIYRGFKFAGGTGTAWELGYARAKNKDVIVLCTDITSKQSLMIINSAIVVMPELGADICLLSFQIQISKFLIFIQIYRISLRRRKIL